MSIEITDETPNVFRDAMSFSFVCAKQDEQGPERAHETSTVMKRCLRCGKHAIAGYWCDEDDCQHQDTEREDQLTGHGPGKCEPKEDAA